LTDATISENIAFGIPRDLINIQRVKKASEKAQLSKFIEGLEKGYNTNVGERGVRLSGGQRQRIGIARALYKQSEIIIFDEATSALDTLTENQVMSAIDELDSNLTIIIVAHRTSTLKNCNYVIDLNNL
jgi:ATP-binding cassette subfamily B protein